MRDPVELKRCKPLTSQNISSTDFLVLEPENQQHMVRFWVVKRAGTLPEGV